MRTKAYAVLDIETGWRTIKDLNDLVSALASLDIRSLPEAEGRFPCLSDAEFAYCKRRLGGGFGTQTNLAHIDLGDVVLVNVEV